MRDLCRYRTKANVSWLILVTVMFLLNYSTYICLTYPAMHYKLQSLSVAVFTTATVIKVLVFDGTAIRKKVFFSVCILLLWISYRFSYNNWLLVLACIAIGANSIKLDTLAKLYFILSVFGLFSATVLLLTGNLTDVITYRDSASLTGVRHSLGYWHPNSVGLWVIVAVFSFLIYKKGKLSIASVLGIIVFVGIYYYFIDSRTSVIAAIMVLIGTLILTAGRKLINNKRLSRCLAPVIIVSIAISYELVTFLRFKGNVNTDMIDRLLNSRLQLSVSAIAKYGLSMMGQRVQLDQFIDSLYTYGPVLIGIIPTVLWVTFTSLASYRGAKNNRWDVVVVSICVALYAVTENMMLSLTNVAALAAFSIIDKPEQPCTSILQDVKSLVGRIKFSWSNMFKTIRKHQFLLEELIKRDFKKKYKGTILGMAWSVLNPLLMLLIMRTVFTHFFGSSIPHYTTYLFCGNIVFSFFNESTSQGMLSLLNNADIFTKVNVPKYLFVLSRSVQTLINFGITLVVFFVLCAFDKITFTWKFVMLLYPILLLILFNTGISMTLSALYMFFRDLQYLWIVFTQLLTYLSAIFYSIDSFPLAVRNAFLLNPVYLFIRYFRKIVIDGCIPSLGFHAFMAAYTLLFLLLGIHMYKKYNTEFLYYV